MKPLIQFTTWQSLEEQARKRTEHQPSSTAQATHCNISLNYTHQRIRPEVLKLLVTLAEERNLRTKISDLMAGHVVNISENRPALHTALRRPINQDIVVNQRNIMEDIDFAMSEMQRMVSKLRKKQWLGSNGEPITDVINIGVGGSDLGPRFCLNALDEMATSELNFHFISNADPNAFHRVTQHLNPTTTLFIVSSKSFTTEETLYNAEKAIRWINNRGAMPRHFIAVTANPHQARALGFTHILPVWSWIGGRYSFCSPINLITAIAIGWDNFTCMQQGAHAMDLHFHNEEFTQNLPVLLALIGIWNNNFLNIQNVLMLVYAEQLEHFVPYVQQLDMESNGKSRDNQGNPVEYATGPLVWGGLGNQIQHSYFQLLCQGTHKIALDLITLKTYEEEMLNTMCAAKIHVLTQGVQAPPNPNGFISGKIPLNHLQLEDSSPFTMGALIALYEHKIFTQAVIWDINPFDQPGVESAKQILRAGAPLRDSSSKIT